MLPAFLFAMYEKDGLPLEKVLKNMITVKFIPVLRCESMRWKNMYEKRKIITNRREVQFVERRENDKLLPEHAKDASYPEDWWLDEADSADGLPVFAMDEAEDFVKDRQRLKGVPMVTGYEALDATSGYPQTKT